MCLPPLHVALPAIMCYFSRSMSWPVVNLIQHNIGCIGMRNRYWCMYPIELATVALYHRTIGWLKTMALFPSSEYLPIYDFPSWPQTIGEKYFRKCRTALEKSPLSWSHLSVVFSRERLSGVAVIFLSRTAQLMLPKFHEEGCHLRPGCAGLSLFLWGQTKIK